MTATSPWFAVAERLVRPTEDPPADDLRRVRPALDPALGDAGRRLVLVPRLHGRVADDEDLRVARDRQVGLDEDPPGSIGLGARSRRHLPRERRRLDAGGPQDGPGRDRLLAALGRDDADAPVVDVDDPGLQADLDAEPLELALGRCRTPGRIRRQHAVHRLDEDDLRVRRTDRPEVTLERVARDLAERAGELDAGRAAADDHERHPLVAAVPGRPRARRPRTR